jgi:hypothetical protein
LFECNETLTGEFFFVFLFLVCSVLRCYVAAVCIYADSAVGHWLLSSARKKIKDEIELLLLFDS